MAREDDLGGSNYNMGWPRKRAGQCAWWVASGECDRYKDREDNRGAWWQEGECDDYVRTTTVNLLQVLVAGSRTPANKKSDEPSRRVESGLGIIDNNAVNLLMAFVMSIGGMVVASFIWDIPLRSIWGLHQL